MGCLYQPRYRDRHGVKKVSAVWWLRYRDAARRLVQECSGTTKVTVNELLDDLVLEYRANVRRSQKRLKFSLAHLRPALGARRAAFLTTADAIAYVAARQDAGAANATINRELAALKRAYTLATRATPPKLHAAPYIALLQEHNVRKGFFERDQFEAVRRHLPAARVSA
jgi:site-specific recombinase XerD